MNTWHSTSDVYTLRAKHHISQQTEFREVGALMTIEGFLKTKNNACPLITLSLFRSRPSAEAVR